MLEHVLSQFSVAGTLINTERFGSGLINETYLCRFFAGGTARKYILQRINASVFRHPDQVMENVEIVTTHIVNRLRTNGVHHPSSVTPSLVYTRNGRPFLLDESGSYWRMFHFIESGEVFDHIGSAEQAYEIGRGLGVFQSLLSDLSPGKLYDTLPGFHYTPNYLADYDNALRSDAAGRASEVAAEQEFVLRRKFLAPLLTDLMVSGEIPMRVVHNDPKVNNIMLNAATGKALCMLDLDTVKAGIVHFDFGDCVRSGANRGGEDAPHVEAVVFDVEYYEAIARGYLREAGVFLTPREIAVLPKSVEVITYELGIRFLADYLRGDTYFKIDYPKHNLHRARVQFKLLQSIEDAGLRPLR